MALTRTQRIASTSAATFGTGAYTTASFTPSNNSVLVVVCAAIQTADGGMEGTDLTITDSAGLTWTAQVATTGSPAWSYGCRIWTAPVTTGVSMTVSVDCGAFSMEFYRVEVFDYTSDTGSAAVGGTATGTDADGDGAASITLSSTPATSSHVLAACMTGLGGASGTITSGSGFTEVNESVMTSWAVVETETRTGSTSTTVDWVDVLATGTGFGGSVLAAVEITEVSSASTDQEGFRFGEDDANEASHTWTDAQDTNITAVAGSKLFRALVDATGDPANAAYTLRAQKNGSGGYTAVEVGSASSPTLSFGAAGTIAVSASGGTSVSPTYPSGITTNSCLVLVIGQKPSTANSGSVTTPTGWTLQTSLTGAGGYGATLGADTGNTNIFVYTKDTVSGSESGTLAVTVGTNGVCWGNIYRVEASAQATFSYDSGTGSDTSAGNVSIATGNIAIAAGDYILAGMCIPTDVTTPAQFSAEALAQTGTTFGTVTEVEEPDSTTGNDIGGFIVRAPVSSGSGSGAVTLTATAGGTTTNVRGPGFVLRIRATGVAREVYVSTSANIAGGGEATTARLTAPSGKSTSDFVTGRRWDDENGSDSIDITTDDYTEVEWSITMAGSLSNGDYFDFRVYAGASPLSSYSQTGRWTIGTGGSPTWGPLLALQNNRLVVRY
ncbi:MAG: hypothetical protein LLG14_27235 [Nocardiaceae bacterium]|nr:hypothetical protein [Nocardiaceae bacterium]